jgi:NADPH2:quinone reductase
VRELTGGEGVRFIFNGVGGDTLAMDAEVTAPFGEIQAYGYVAGKKPFDLFRVKHSIAIKTFSADDFFATPMFPAATEAMHEWFRSGRLLAASVILPLEQAAEANRMLERGEVLGKIALRP